MKNQPPAFKSGALRRFLRATSFAGLLPALVLLAGIQSSFAGSATWLSGPATGDWNAAANWTAGGPPNGSADTATFASSNITSVSLSLSTEVNGIVFNSGASTYTITASPLVVLKISGVGITNNSGIIQNFVTAVDTAPNTGYFDFRNSATAGSLTTFTNSGSAVSGHPGGVINFFDTSTAGGGSFTNNGGTVTGAFGGLMSFLDTSTAGSGTFKTNGGTATGAFGAQTYFDGTSTAGSGTFTTNGGTGSGAGGGQVRFNDTSTASNATLIANSGSSGGGGGLILFFGESTGGTARVKVVGNGTLDVSNDTSARVATGSIEGSGLVFLGGTGSLGASNLTVGANNLSTTFSGVIEDGGLGGGTGGSLTKVGTGTLTLSGANTYTGGTTVTSGTLLLSNRRGSGTGTGVLTVTTSTLGGTGIVGGTVRVGSNSGLGASLSPGNAGIGMLTIKKTLTFKGNATYTCELDSNAVTADQIIAKGVAINGGALVSLDDLGALALTAGTVYTIINNTAATPIAGTFANLADGATLTVGNNTYKANYEGGTGNDLTLTVQ